MNKDNLRKQITYLFIIIYFSFLILLLPFAHYFQAFFINDDYFRMVFINIMLVEGLIIILIIVLIQIGYFLNNFTIIKRKTLKKLKSN